MAPPDDQGNGKQKKTDEPVVATPAAPTVPPPSADDQGNGKGKAKHDSSPVQPQPVAPADVVTTPPAVVPAKSKGHNK